MHSTGHANRKSLRPRSRDPARSQLTGKPKFQIFDKISLFSNFGALWILPAEQDLSLPFRIIEYHPETHENGQIVTGDALNGPCEQKIRPTSITGPSKKPVDWEAKIPDFDIFSHIFSTLARCGSFPQNRICLYRSESSSIILKRTKMGK